MEADVYTRCGKEAGIVRTQTAKLYTGSTRPNHVQRQVVIQE